MTNATKHTQGPWFVYDTPKTSYVMTGKPAYNICELQNGNQLFNANLIAADPDLLEALKNLIAIANKEIRETRQFEDALDVLRKAEWF